MAIFKQALAFPVFAAAAYFLWIFSQQTGGSGLAIILTGIIVLAFAAWAFELSKADGVRGLLLRAAAGVAALIALVPLMRIEAPNPAAVAGQKAGVYGAFEAEPYSKEALAEYRAAGIPVFIDFTAAWCVTCQFDRITVLSDSDLKRTFDDHGVVFMVADWTVRDPEITDAIQSYGASGVPLYVFESTKAPAQVMPLPLSGRAIENAILGRT